MKTIATLLLTAMVTGATTNTTKSVLLTMKKHEDIRQKRNRVESARLSGRQYVEYTRLYKGNTAIVSNDNVAYLIEGKNFIKDGESIEVKNGKLIAGKKKYRIIKSVILND